MSYSHILVINSGSSSIKYSFFDVRTAGRRNKRGGEFVLLRKGLIERIGQRGSGVRNHKEGVRLLLKILASYGILSQDAQRRLCGVGHRVVHGGIAFKEPVVIGAPVLAKIRECSELAPLHNPANLSGIEACRDLLAGVPQVAVFDTAFHQTMPEHAYVYGLPYEYCRKYHLRRFGFHGTSHEYVAREAARILGKPLTKTKLITCHLGNGCSMTAVKHGESIDTSMGFTPLEGLVMGTRCGDIDPASIIYLAAKEKLTLREIDAVLNHKSGLRGISGVSSDMREIMSAASRGHRRARLAIEIFTYRVRKYIGSYIVALGGVDAIVFTGGIGENQPGIRKKAVEGLFRLLDPKKTRILVIPTNEEVMIAQQTYGCIRQAERRRHAKDDV